MEIILAGERKAAASSITLLKAVKYATPDFKNNQTNPMDHPVIPRAMEHKVAAF